MRGVQSKVCSYEPGQQCGLVGRARGGDRSTALSVCLPNSLSRVASRDSKRSDAFRARQQSMQSMQSMQCALLSLSLLFSEYSNIKGRNNVRPRPWLRRGGGAAERNGTDPLRFAGMAGKGAVSHWLVAPKCTRSAPRRRSSPPPWVVRSSRWRHVCALHPRRARRAVRRARRTTRRAHQTADRG